MKFSEVYKIERTSRDEWFDPVLSVDTRLFVDPFLLYTQEENIFKGSHDEIVAFFNHLFELVARSGGDPDSPHWRRAVRNMLFPEVEETCLGYTAAGTRGAGSGRTIATSVISAIAEAVQRGKHEIRHFEEVAIFREGIGADRISDIATAIIRWRLASYTSRICEEHGVGVKGWNFQRGRFDGDLKSWVPLKASLPRNPYSGRGILLVPRVFLRDLPSINTDDFWEYIGINENRDLREEFGFDISSRVDKKTIIEYASRHPGAVERYITHREQEPTAPYDLVRDSKLLYRWYEASKSYVHDHPLELVVERPDDFESVVETMNASFKLFVEENRGWRLLWNENRTPRRETAAQDLYLGVVKHYCEANDIDVSREADLGRGSVDFKVSRGQQFRALIEVKLAKNGRFWRGLARQLPAYLKAESIRVGYFLVVAFDDADFGRWVKIEAQAKDLNKILPYELRIILVNARHSPTSASRL